LRRNLTAGEIVAQVRLAKQWIASHPEWLADVPHPARRRVSNIVFMGMGEPLDNVESVIKSIGIMTEPHGFYLAIRRISVSTAGNVDGMKRLAMRLPNVRLAIALHAVPDEKRSLIMPINQRWPLASLLDCLHDLTPVEKHGFLIQYLLIGGFNDSVADADGLVRLLSGLEVKVNLIPVNPIDTQTERPLAVPTPQSVEAFCDRLHESGIRVMIRFSKGQDISAACGQLAAEDWSGPGSGS
jgi:23S rRNA (adenine2503-C2)-methyltransferase